MEKQVTAVEWLLDNLISEPYSEADFEHNSKCWDKAKAMEKNNVMDAWDDGCYQSSRFPRTSDAERYYNETFKTESINN